MTRKLDAAKSSYDLAFREKELAAIQRAVHDQSPTIVIDARKELYAYDDDLKDPHPDPISAFDGMLSTDI